MQDILYIVMPAYNEAANIEKVVRQWYPNVADKAEGSKLVVADAGSTDATHEVLQKLQEELPRLEILTKSGKQHGPKCIALYEYAIDHEADYVFQTDSDGQTDPSEFAVFWRNRRRFDAILGNRTDRGDGKARFAVEKVVTLLLKLFFGVSVPDANAPFRLMRCDCLEKYLYRMPKDYFLPNIMLTTYFKFYGEKLAFKRISFKPRIGGENSIDLIKITKIGLDALGDFRRFRKDMFQNK